MADPPARAPHRPSRRLAIAALTAMLLLVPGAAAARDVALGGGASVDSARLMQLVIATTLLSLAPGILMTITSFTRIVVALSLLRTGIGAPGVPPNPVIIALALFLSAFVMAPTFQTAWTQGLEPYGAGRITEAQAYDRTVAPFRQFMLKQVREEDLKLFADLSPTPLAKGAPVPMSVLAPAFMISELRRAFEIGFMLLLPFLVIDLAVAAVLMAMGMMMLPPPSIALPCKIIFFVLVDGWALVAGSLIRSFG